MKLPTLARTQSRSSDAFPVRRPAPSTIRPCYTGANAPNFAAIRAIGDTSPNAGRSFGIEYDHVGYLLTGRAGGRKQADPPAIGGVAMHLSINPGPPVAGGDSDFHIVADGGGQSVAWHYQLRCGNGGDNCSIAATRFDNRGNGVWWTGLGGTADELSEAAQGFATAFVESFNDDSACGENPNCP